MSPVPLGMPTVASDPHGHLRGTESFPAAAHRALADTQLRRNLGHATATIRAASGNRCAPSRLPTSRRAVGIPR